MGSAVLSRIFSLLCSQLWLSSFYPACLTYALWAHACRYDVQYDKPLGTGLFAVVLRATERATKVCTVRTGVQEAVQHSRQHSSRQLGCIWGPKGL